MNNYFRKINTLMKTNFNDIFLYNCNQSVYPIQNLHWGQVKLLYSEIEFLTLVSKEYSLKDVIAVYIGAAPGDHTLLLLKLFPDLHMLLYDPRKFNSELINHKRVTIRNMLFDVEQINYVKQFAKNKKILFISDIRREVNEIEILEDNINQQKWGILLQADYMFLKLRMPYLNKTEFKLLDYDLSDIRKYVNTPNSIFGNYLLYLDGHIYTQLFPKIKSTETRLFVKKQSNNKYNLKYYDIYNYDKTLSYFNIYLRSQQYQYKKSYKIKNHILGFSDHYDYVGIYYILHKYFKYYLKIKSNKINFEVTQMINNLVTEFNNFTRKNVVTIHIKQFYTELNNISNILTTKNYNINNIVNFVRDVFVFLNNLILTYKNQYQLVLNSSQIKNISAQINSFNIGSNNLITIKNDNIIIQPVFLNLLNKISIKLQQQIK